MGLCCFVHKYSQALCQSKKPTLELLKWVLGNDYCPFTYILCASSYSIKQYWSGYRDCLL